MEGKCNNIGFPIYISYSHENEYEQGYIDNMESPVNYLVDSLEKLQYDVRQDKNCEYDRISAFEKEIGNAKIVIIFLSQKYLKSKHCMYEWTEIHKNLDWNNKERENNNKKIIYIRYNGISQKSDTKWEFNKWYPELRRYWEDELNTYWKKYVREQRTADLIDKETYKNEFYFNAMKKIMNGPHRDTPDWYYTSDLYEGDAIDKIINSIKNYIKNQHDYEEKQWEKFLCNKTILLVGDSALQYHYNDVTVQLGEYIEANLAEWLYMHGYDMTVREFNRLMMYSGNAHHIKDYYKTIFEEKIKKENILFDKLKKLLESYRFDMILSVGYSGKIIEAVKAAYANELNIIEYVKGLQFTQQYKEGDVNYYQLVPCISKYTESREILFSEYDLTKFTYDFISAVKSKKIGHNRSLNYYNDKKLIILGTNFPGWALRFVWTTLTGVNKQESIIINKDVDSKSYKFIAKQSEVLVIKNKDNRLEDIMIRLTKLANNHKKENLKPTKTNIYVCYYDNEPTKNKLYEDRVRFIDIEKNADLGVNFVWRTYYQKRNNQRKTQAEIFIDYCKLFVIYRPCSDKNKNSFDERSYADEFNFIMNNQEHKNVFLIDCNATLDNSIEDVAHIQYDEDGKWAKELEKLLIKNISNN